GGSGIVVVRYTTADFDPPISVRGTNFVPNLFGFKLNPYLVDMRVNSITFSLTLADGVVDGDWRNVAIMEDPDGSGYIEGTERTQVGGVATVNTSAGTITFSAPFIVPAAGMNYVMRADIADLQSGDTFTLGLAMSNIVVVSTTNTSDKAIKFNGSAAPVTHVASPEIVWDGGAGDGKWNSRFNWDPDVVPDAGSEVTIDANAVVTAAEGEAGLNFATLTLGSAAGTYSPSLVLSTHIASGGSIEINNGASFVYRSQENLSVGGDVEVNNGGVFRSSTTYGFAVGGDLIVRSGGLLTHNVNFSTLASYLNLDVAGNFDLQAGGLVNGDYMGYSAGGPGVGGSTTYDGGGGGGYGGVGGRGGNHDNGGVAYGSAEAPADAGSKGGDCTQGAHIGGTGGGYFKLNVGGLSTLDGTITMNGGNGDDGVNANANQAAGG
ncbi:MAG TPA: hypothetical protein PK523_12915, partial [Elusimicrobiales bacterium]|nr:hypothetical protein [Elusimicrobiales bacterium]